jgi:capsular polysaccharide biosynthesis protein
VLLLPGGRALGAEGGIVTPDDAVLEDLSPEFNIERYIRGRHTALTSLRLGLPRYLPGSTVVLATLAQMYFSHWMLDLIPRIRVLQAAGVAAENIDWFYLPRPVRGYERESLEAAGIPLERVIDSQENRHIQAERLIVPSPVDGVFQTSGWSAEHLVDLFAPEKHRQRPLSRRIFISRRGAGHRRILNEDELFAALAPLGFVSVQPESMRLKEQAALFADADVIVAPHGSGFANYVYCAPGAAVVEVQPRDLVHTCGLTVCSERGIHYGYTRSRSTNGHALTSDMTVDVSELLAVLELVEQSRADQNGGDLRH